ncbi:hypothetical protein TNCV_12931 [Trichonephila clavipes]|nr:hypothetical protein TNCV_12931 [Trichonephila clavipes]
MGQSNRTLSTVLLGRVNRYPYPRIKCIKYGNLNLVMSRDLSFVKSGRLCRKKYRGILGHGIGFVEVVLSSFCHDELSEVCRLRYSVCHLHD